MDLGPVDMLGGTIKVNDIVVWTYNMGIPGGSKPFTAFGRVIKITAKMALIEAIFVRGNSNKNGEILRAQLDNLAVLDEHVMGRLLGKKLSV